MKPTRSSRIRPKKSGASRVFDAETDLFESHEKVYSGAFRKLYYHLYSNSMASRAERIMSDLSNLLLCKIAAERNGGQDKVEAFLAGDGSANSLLLPLLQKSFPHLINKDDEFSLDDKTLRYGLAELSPISLRSAPAHVMGEAFQALMGPRLRGDKGQFFTPKSLVRAMVAILDPPHHSKVVDPACGTGGFLLETYSYQLSCRRDDIGKLKTRLIGIDKDRDLCRLAEATLEIGAPELGIVLNLNSLDYESLCRLPMDISPVNASFVLTNPPFGTKIKITEKDILRQYELGHKWRVDGNNWRPEIRLRDAQDPQILFLELCIRLLKPGGRLGIVLPEGVFGNNNMGYVWDYVRKNGKIVALIDCPRTTFQPSTDTKTNVLFFEKHEGASNESDSKQKVWTAIALQCGHDRRGRTRTLAGDPYPDDFLAIGSDFHQRERNSRLWQNVMITDKYYLCPRYYDQATVQELRTEASKLGADILSVGEMVKMGFVRIRKGNEVGAEAYGSGEVPFVRTSDISNYEISIDPTRSISEEIYQQFATQQRLSPTDILMVADGRYRIGRTAILNEHNYKCVVQSHIRIISVTSKSPIDSIELLYLLNLPKVQHQIRNLVFIQSTLGSLGKRINEILLPIPKKDNEWSNRIEDFRQLVTQRAHLLRRLSDFEHPGYEL